MGRSVRFLDPDGQWWEAHEAVATVNLADAPGRRSARLYFFSGRTTLKLELYPSDWDRLPAHVLEELRQAAAPVSSFRTPAGRDGAVSDLPVRERAVQAR